MKPCILLFITFLTASAYSYNNVQTTLELSSNQLCIKSYSRTKCSTDSFTEKQKKKMKAKIIVIQNKIPGHILNDTLNHFWANHHKFNSGQLLSLFEKADSPSCESKISIQKKRSLTIKKQMDSFKRVLNALNKDVAQSCISSNIADRIYPIK